MSVRGWVQGCEWQPRGSELTEDAAVGATVLTVEDPTDFDDAAGVVLLNDERLTYAAGAVDEDASTITVDSPISEAATAGDWVYVVSGGQTVQDCVLFVSCGDGDAVEVIVPFTQRDLWPEGDYDDDVQILLSDDLEKIEEVPGRVPVPLSADAATVAAGDAFAQAEAALSATQLAIAVSDGRIDSYFQTAPPWANGDLTHDDDLGDLWVDIDSGTPNLAYRWMGRFNRSWVLIEDQSIIAALNQAESAQTTADGKITHFVGSSTPTAEGYGDIWTNTALDNRKYYWDGDSWEPLILGDDGIVAELIGKILTAGFIRTAASGGRVEVYTSGSEGWVEFYDSGGSLIGKVRGESGGVLRIQSAATGNYVAVNSGGVTLAGGLITLVGDVQFSGDPIDFGNGVNLTAAGLLDMGGHSVTNAFNVLAQNLVQAPQLRQTTPGSTGSAANVFMNGSGDLVKSTSSRRYKTNIEDAPDHSAAVRALRRRTFTRPADDDPTYVYLGLIAEEVHDLGLTQCVQYDDEGRPDGIDWNALTVAVLGLAQNQQAQIDDLTARLEALEAL